MPGLQLGIQATASCSHGTSASPYQQHRSLAQQPRWKGSAVVAHASDRCTHEQSAGLACLPALLPKRTTAERVRRHCNSAAFRFVPGLQAPQHLLAAAKPDHAGQQQQQQQHGITWHNQHQAIGVVAATAMQHRLDETPPPQEVEQVGLHPALRVVIDCSYANSALQPTNLQQQWRPLWQDQQPHRDSCMPGKGQSDAAAQPSAWCRPSLMPGYKNPKSMPQPPVLPPTRAGLQSQSSSSVPVRRPHVSGAFIHKEIRSLAKQIELSAAIIKRAAAPVALTVTSFHGPLADFANHMGAAAWRMETHSQDLMNVFPSSQLVLLSPDAPEPLMAVDNSKVYVVGGIVDKTVQKGITFSFAQQQGLPVYRLPIREYAQQLGLDFPGASTRPVLSAADVVTALVEYQQMQDWAAALKVAVPQRKRRQHGSLAARQM